MKENHFNSVFPVLLVMAICELIYLSILVSFSGDELKMPVLIMNMMMVLVMAICK